MASRAIAANPESWTRPIAPFRIVGDVYYVGTQGLAAYLIVTPKGEILLDGTLAENAPLIERNMAALGFRVQDVKVLLCNHAHSDHAGGLAQIKADSGARLIASEADRWALEHGQARGDTDYGPLPFPAVRVDRAVKDGEAVTLGGVTMTAVLTPGHTPGCTTWSLQAVEAGRPLRVTFLCSITVAGNTLVGNRAYPGIARDFRQTFTRLRTMRADVVLTGHPEIAGVLTRHDRQARGEADAYVDPALLQRIVTDAQSAFEDELAKAQGSPVARHQ